MEQEEIWRDIEGYEGLYQVSNFGRVKSLGNDKTRKEKILRPAPDKNGYLRVCLHKEGKGKMFYVHRLVAHAFIPNPEGLPIINHKDENPSNNVVFLNDDGSVDESNLEWCTVTYNNNYGTTLERQVQTKISKGIYDPEMCGIADKKEYDCLYRQKNRELIRERDRLRYRENRDQILEQKQVYYQKNQEQIRERRREQYHRLKRKQEKKKDNRPSEVSLW